MSFASDAKKELCPESPSPDSLYESELYAMLLLSKVFTKDKIIFKTENKHTAQRFCDLCTRFFSVIVDFITPPQDKPSKIYIVKIPDSNDCKLIFDYFGHDERQITLRVNMANLPDEYSERAFIRGVFLSCGSVTDPEKAYHLELCIVHKNLCTDICRLISQISDCDISVKMINRNGSYTAYIKDSEQITDFLAYIGASNSAMSIMGCKALKQVRNTANRITNSEIANLQKIASASAVQIKAIHKLEATGELSTLSDELQQVARLRLQYPELSLRDMGLMTTPQLSRSGVNHRLKKLIELASEVN